MHINAKVTRLTNIQWLFIERHVLTEYPMNGIPVHACYELAPGVEFNTVLPLYKFTEIQRELAHIDKFGHPSPAVEKLALRGPEHERLLTEEERTWVKKCLVLTNEMLEILADMRSETERWR